MEDVKAAIARVEALLEVERREVRELAAVVRELVTQQAAQNARVEAFWTSGKGAQWDRDIRANTEALTELTARLTELETEGRVSKARAVGIIGGASLGGAGLAELLRGLFGG